MKDAEPRIVATRNEYLMNPDAMLTPTAASGEKPQIEALEWTDEYVSSLWEYYSTFQPEAYFTAQFGTQIIDETAKFLPDGSVCDFGCGAGFLLGHLLRDRKAAGFDFTRQSLEVARNRYGGQPNLLGLFHLDEIDKIKAAFDAVYFVETVEHLLPSHIESTFTLLHSVLRPGGILVCTTPNDEDLAESQVFCPVTRKFFHKYQHVCSFTADSLTALFRRHGFDVVRTFTTDFAAATTMSRLKRYIRPYFGKKNPHLVLIARKPLASSGTS